MGWIVLFVGISIAYLAVRAFARLVSGVAGTRYRAYRSLATDYHGRYENRGMADPPTVSFSHKGSTVRVGLAPTAPGQSLGPRTRVVARFARGLPLRMELAPVGRPSPAQPPKGTRPVRVGDLDFDRRFTVQANDPEMARDFLNAPARWAIGSLQELGPPAGILVSINPERLLVQVDANLGVRTDFLAAAVREALVLHDRLQDGVATRISEGVAIVAAGSAQPEDAGPPLCKVCGDPIAEPPVVVCATCRTPHHGDCWEFVGGCSIFGCNGKVPQAVERTR